MTASTRRRATYGAGTPAVITPVFVSANAANNLSGNANVAAPASIALGNLLIAIGINVEAGGDVSILPSGFTTVAQNTGDVAMTIGWKIATGSEPGTYSFSDDQENGGNAGAILNYSTASFDAFSDINTDTNTTWSTLTFEAVAPQIAVAAIGTLDGVVVSAPAGGTLRASTRRGGALSLYVFDLAETSVNVPAISGSLGDDSYTSQALTIA